MKKLFALEENEELVGVEMETSPEEGEVADVQAEVEAEVTEVESEAAAIVDADAASDQLEEVSEFVETVSEDEGSEGLDPVAAEAISIAVRAIADRVGASSRFGEKFAAENFSSKSSRKANTTFALEGVKEFLKDLWKKIKAALESLWAKVKAFWDKHISSLGRVQKALEATKTKLAESSGKLKDKAYLEEAPSNMEAAFGHVGDISPSTIKAVIEAHVGIANEAEELVASTENFNKAAAVLKDEDSLAKAMTAAVMLGNAKSKKGKTGTLVGGTTVEVDIEVDKEEGTVTITVEKEQVDRKDKAGISLAEKSDVKGLLDACLVLIKDNVKARDKVAKAQEAFNKAASALTRVIDGGAGSDEAKALRKGLKALYAVNAKIPSINAQMVSMNVRLAKNVIGYAQLCMKHYK